MANIGGVIGIYQHFKAHILLFLAQICLAFMYFITQASFNHGMSPYVYVTYRQIIGGLVMLPFAYFLERNVRPKLTLALLLQFFVLSLLGVGLSLNMCYTSMKYTSSTLVSCVLNTIAPLTFILAVIFRLEIVNFKSPRGIAKVIGTGVCLVGAMTMTLYKGPGINKIGHALVHIGESKAVVQQKWLLGSLLVVASCISWSIVNIVLAYTLKKYPAELSLTTWMNFCGAAQSAVFTIIVEHKRTAWTIGINIDLWSTLYGGIVIAGVVTLIQIWCTAAKGPVFAAVFGPLSAILVAILSYFVLGEKLYVGSVIGGIIVIVGLYALLWGKEHDEEQLKLNEAVDPKTQNINGQYLEGEP